MHSYDPSAQRLFTDDTLNLRELGGMPLEGDHIFRKNLFVRSGAPGFMTPEGITKIKEYGVKTVIDLRSEAELLHYGNAFRDDADVTFYNIPLFVGDPDAAEDPTMHFLRTHHLGDFYVVMLEELGERLIEILRILLKTDHTVLFHCAHGKDRTGVVAAILYLIAGATRENIILNYKVSYDYARSLLDPLIEAKEVEMRHTLRSDAINMEIFLDYIDNEYNGDISLYLTKNGMTSEEIQKLREKIVI